MKNDRDRIRALLYHSKPSPGKIKVIPSKNYSQQTDLSLAYSPGVAYPCLEIHEDSENVYKYTWIQIFIYIFIYIYKFIYTYNKFHIHIYHIYNHSHIYTYI